MNSPLHTSTTLNGNNTMLHRPARMSTFSFFTFILFLIVQAAQATTFTCQTPTVGGTFTISMKSATDNCGPVKVNIPAGSTATQKAALIAAKINASCAGVFTATSSGDDVTVTNAVHPGQRVFFNFGKDDTGEKDKIEEDLTPGWWGDLWGDTAPLFVVSASAGSSSASGIAVDGTSPGKIYIGTSTHVATVLTLPGMTPFDIVSQALTQLTTFGVPGCFITEMPSGAWGLSFKVKPTDTFVEFGDNDTGVETSFEMFEPPAMTVHQLNFDLDGTITPDSEWGVVDLNFMGAGQIMYLNLAIGTQWVIQNIPVLSLQGAGVEQTQRFWFDIGTPGESVSTLVYSIMLTPTISIQPTYFITQPVTPDWVRIKTGLTGLPPGGGGPGPAGVQAGGAAVDPAPKLHMNFPNQESPNNYCVPTGVSNSLQWLNTENNLGMNPAKISIPALANAFGTNPNSGTPRNSIYKNKKDYCKKNKLPITTRKFKGSQIGDVAKEIKNGQDVELMVDWIGQGGKGHCVAVTGITDHGGGKYSLVITHDKDQQNNTAGTVDENATYDKNTKKWGGALSNASGQSGDILFIVECPVVKSKQTTNNLPGGSSYRTLNDARVTYNQGKHQVRNLQLSNYENLTTPPPLGGTIVFSVSCLAELDLSADTGVTFSHFMAPCQLLMRVTHSLDSGGVQYFGTEILQMQLQEGSLPPGVFIRESPVPSDTSTGLQRIRPVPGGYQIDSFFDIFTELSIDGGATWQADDNETTVLSAYGPTVLSIVYLNNIVVDPLQPVCYDATQKIMVAGPDGPFIIPPGANVTMIAGQSILLLDGFQGLPGCSMHAYITPNGEFCPDQPFVPMTAPVTLTSDQIDLKTISSGHYTRLYPNPASGVFTVEIDRTHSTGMNSVSIFNPEGKQVARFALNGELKYEFVTDYLKPGIYFVRVVTGNQRETVKLVIVR